MYTYNICTQSEFASHTLMRRKSFASFEVKQCQYNCIILNVLKALIDQNYYSHFETCLRRASVFQAEKFLMIQKILQKLEFEMFTIYGCKKVQKRIRENCVIFGLLACSRSISMWSLGYFVLF